jgi:hypothetical protein
MWHQSICAAAERLTWTYRGYTHYVQSLQNNKLFAYQMLDGAKSSSLWLHKHYTVLHKTTGSLWEDKGIYSRALWLVKGAFGLPICISLPYQMIWEKLLLCASSHSIPYILVRTYTIELSNSLTISAVDLHSHWTADIYVFDALVFSHKNSNTKPK